MFYCTLPCDGAGAGVFTGPRQDSFIKWLHLSNICFWGSNYHIFATVYCIGLVRFTLSARMDRKWHSWPRGYLRKWCVPSISPFPEFFCAHFDHPTIITCEKAVYVYTQLCIINHAAYLYGSNIYGGNMLALWLISVSIPVKIPRTRLINACLQSSRRAPATPFFIDYLIHDQHSSGRPSERIFEPGFYFSIGCTYNY